VSDAFAKLRVLLRELCVAALERIKARNDVI
jgi:hypothetical protein